LFTTTKRLALLPGENVYVIPGKTGSVDHPSPDCNMLGKLQNVKAFALLTRIGLKWSGGLIFPPI